jgi:hypothetical protein
MDIASLEPKIHCKYPDCDHFMVLPYRIVPFVLNEENDDAIQDEINKHRSRWPKDNWQAAIGCPKCGNILLYVADDVSWREEFEWEDADPYDADTVCYSVSCECATKDCRSPVRFHIIAGDDENQDWSEDALRNRLHDAFYVGQCPAGHSLLPIPRDRYRLETVRGPIPKDGSSPLDFLDTSD